MNPEKPAFEYDSDLESHRWLQERILQPEANTWHALYHVVPDGYPAYARIFHPASRSRIIGELTWQQLEADARREIFHHDLETEDEDIRWAQAAEAFGTTMHPSAQWYRILGHTEAYSHQDAIDSAGWRYHEPAEGRLDVAQLRVLAEILSQHSNESGQSTFAIWEGWGGLTSSDGYATFRFYGGLRGKINHWRHRLMQHYRGPRLRLRRHAKPGSGVLTEEASTGPRLELPNRNYVLFRGDLQSFANNNWVHTAPWLRENETQHPQTPSLFWPRGREWVVATEIDFDSTVVAGSRELIDQLLEHPELETAEISIGHDLTHFGDIVNR